MDPAHHVGAYGTMRLAELVETRVRDICVARALPSSTEQRANLAIKKKS